MVALAESLQYSVAVLCAAIDSERESGGRVILSWCMIGKVRRGRKGRGDDAQRMWRVGSGGANIGNSMQ